MFLLFAMFLFERSWNYEKKNVTALRAPPPQPPPPPPLVLTPLFKCNAIIKKQRATLNTMKSNISGAWNRTTMKSQVSEVLKTKKNKKKNNICYKEKVFSLSYKSKIMLLLRILVKKKTSSTLTSSNQQTTSTNSTPNIEPPSLFPAQEESQEEWGNSSFMCYLLGMFFSHSSTPSPGHCKWQGKKLTCCNEFLSFLDVNCMIMK